MVLFIFDSISRLFFIEKIFARMILLLKQKTFSILLKKIKYGFRIGLECLALDF